MILFEFILNLNEFLKSKDLFSVSKFIHLNCEYFPNFYLFIFIFSKSFKKNLNFV
jgi:hypothetical protein